VLANRPATEYQGASRAACHDSQVAGQLCMPSGCWRAAPSALAGRPHSGRQGRKCDSAVCACALVLSATEHTSEGRQAQGRPRGEEPSAAGRAGQPSAEAALIWNPRPDQGGDKQAGPSPAVPAILGGRRKDEVGWAGHGRDAVLFNPGRGAPGSGINPIAPQ